MNETTLLLAPTPKAPGEFLVTIECNDADLELPFEITLNQYSRDRSWIESPMWKKTSMKIVPGQERRYPGFLKYIQERQKSAWGTFTTTSSTKGIFLIPHTHKGSGATEVFCYIGTDPRLLQPTRPPQPAPVQQRQVPEIKNQPKKAPPKARSNNSQTNTKPSKSGLLGNLLGAQRRTNNHMDNTTGMKSQASTTSDSAVTAGQVIAKFRNQMEDKLMKFQSSSDTFTLKIPVSLAEQTGNLAPGEEVTMDILKYIINEQVEEIDDRWIAIREPGEFIDEAVFVVYKEGHCPEEILQEYNKGDLPDELRGQQRALREVSVKTEQKKLQEIQRDNERSVHSTATNITTALNQNKRDRRTIEEIQRGIKRQKN